MDSIVVLGRIAGGAAIDVVAVWIIMRSMSFDDGRDTDALFIIAFLVGLASLFVYPVFISMMILGFGGAIITSIGANGVWPPHPNQWDREHRKDSVVILTVGLTMVIVAFAILGYLAYTTPAKVIPTCLC